MKVNDLRKVYQQSKSQSVVALDGVSFTLPENGLVFILGKSGSGKSTLLNLLGGLDTATDGSIQFDGKEITKLSGRELSEYRNSCLGFIFQDYSLIAELNVYENIALSIELQGEKDISEKVKEVLKKVGLENYENRNITELSGGQKQRVAIARALIKNPAIIFADEPTGALDNETGQSILELLKEFSNDRLVVIVSHDREFAEKYGDRIIELSDGKIIRDTGEDNFPSCTAADVSTNQRGKKTQWERPKLSTKCAFKIGCSNFKYHPVRLAATIFLSVIAFSLLGLSLNISFQDFKNLAPDYWETLEMVQNVAEILSGIFAVLAALLLLNFMLQSVLDKTKIIGILKSHGCDTAILSKIFLAEATILAAIVFVITSFVVVVLCAIIDHNMTPPFHAVFAVFLSLFAVIFFFAFLGSILPILYTKKLSPHEIILRGE